MPDFVRSWLRLHEPAVLGFHPRGGDAAAAAGRRPAARAPPICYEDAYGSSMLQVLPQADALVNVTNDAWFGHSTARYQHFQIARMRAMEAGRYLVRAANDGISAVIGPHGEVVARAPEFRPLCHGLKDCPRRRADALRACWKLADREPGGAGAGVRAVGAE